MWPQPIALNDTFLVTQWMRYNAEIYMNTHHYAITQTVGAATVGDVYNGLIAKFTDVGGANDKTKALIGSDVTIYQTSVQRVDSTNTPARLSAFKQVANFVGTRLAGNTGNVALVITRRGDPAKRTAVGRVHIPIADADDNMVNGLITQDLKDLADTYINNLKLPVVIAGLCTLTPCLWNVHSAPRTNTIITQWFTQDTVRVMTRRTVRRGI